MKIKAMTLGIVVDKDETKQLINEINGLVNLFNTKNHTKDTFASTHPALTRLSNLLSEMTGDFE